MQSLRGRTCIFSGATAGDGRAAVKALCTGGMNVVMMTHNEAYARSLIEEVSRIEGAGACVYYTGKKGSGPAEANDVTYAEIEERFGSVDVIISNTGSDGQIDDLETIPPEALQKNVDHLLMSAFKMMQAALPYLKKSKAPRIIFMTTTEGIRGGTQESFANAVAKGAVASLALNSAARLVKYGITVNAIAKGAIRRMEPVQPGSPNPDDRLAAIPMGRVGDAQDLANAICFLASEESSYITGQIMELSGGMNLGR